MCASLQIFFAETMPLLGLFISLRRRLSVIQHTFPVVHFLVQNLQSTLHSKVPPPPPPPPEMKIVRDFRYQVTEVGLQSTPPPPPGNENCQRLQV